MGKKTKPAPKVKVGLDFVKAKRKVGRKIPQASNATDSTVRSKRINLAHQAIGGEGKGDAVTSRGLALPELLGQTGHYSTRVRRDALEGIKEGRCKLDPGLKAPSSKI